MDKSKLVSDFISKELASRFGGGEATKLYVITNVHAGDTEVVVEHTISERYPIQELEKAADIYERFGLGGGRYCMTLEQILNFRPVNPKKED